MGSNYSRAKRWKRAGSAVVLMWIVFRGGRILEDFRFGRPVVVEVENFDWQVTRPVYV